jgi:4-aminobutyrate aminotransferase-like enzyme
MCTGGNPVCCAAGLAVFAELERLDLKKSATTVGAHLRLKLRELAATPAGKLIGQVRGMGLFVGIEFVQDRETKVPATTETSWVCSWLKDHDILTSIDGACDNVIVMKPPMVFSVANVDTFVAALCDALAAVEKVDLATVKRTPT